MVQNLELKKKKKKNNMCQLPDSQSHLPHHHPYCWMRMMVSLAVLG